MKRAKIPSPESPPAGAKAPNPEVSLSKLSSLQWPKPAVVPKRFQSAMQLLAQDDGDLFLEVIERESRDALGLLTVEHHVRCRLCRRFATDDHLCQPAHKKKHSRFLVDSQAAHARRTMALALASDGPPGKLADERCLNGRDWPIIGLNQYMHGITNRRLAPSKAAAL